MFQVMHAKLYESTFIGTTDKIAYLNIYISIYKQSRNTNAKLSIM